MSDGEQVALFPDLEAPAEWEAEWQGMPEFVQEKQDCHQSIVVRFPDEAAVQEFAELIGQKLTSRTKSIWHPFRSHWGNGITRWTDEP